MGEHTASTADILLATLQGAGVRYLFANFGSDHPGIIEALARRQAAGDKAPEVILCPHEMTALSAAHGFAAVTASPQAVIVHTDVGTANLGGSVHNAARSRVPALILAGLTPYTLENELPGSRTIHSNFLQDVAFQHDLVRPYVKWSYDLRTGANVRQVVSRGLQLAASDPRGPVYLSMAREVLAEQVPEPGDGGAIDPAAWRPVAPTTASDALMDELIHDIGQARLAVVVTSYLGSRPAAVALLVSVAERLGLAVVESVPYAMNFPGRHRQHLGFDPGWVVPEADLVLALDTDLPSVLATARPRPDARCYVVDVDPLKESIPLWYWPAQHFVRADGESFLRHLIRRLDVLADPAVLPSAPEPGLDAAGAEARLSRIIALRDQHQALGARGAGAKSPDPGPLTTELVCRTLAEIIDDDTVIVDESITGRSLVSRFLPRTQPGTFIGNGGTALGWSGGAALGIKLARPEALVVALVGDGSYLLSEPSSTYWVAARYGIPFLTIVLNNGGWNATKQNLLGQYPEGVAATTDSLWVNLAQTADLAGIAQAAGGAFAATVSNPGELTQVLIEAVRTVRAGRPAVVEVRLPTVSSQPAR